MSADNIDSWIDSLEQAANTSCKGLMIIKEMSISARLDVDGQLEQLSQYENMRFWDKKYWQWETIRSEILWT